MKFALVIIDISAKAVDRPFTYIIPRELEKEILVGSKVKVPFGRANIKKDGVVIGIESNTNLVSSQIKTILEKAEGGTDSDTKLIELAIFMAHEYGCTLSQALKTVLPERRIIRKNKRRTDPTKVILASGDFKEEKVELSLAQRRVYEEIKQSEKPSLLYGITGSGKTRIYIELIRSMQKEKKTSILLIPEISLAFQTIRELKLYLGDRVGIMHSRLSKGEKYEQYQRIVSGKIDVVVGPRSALFSPLPNLGLIIIDEEHENSYHSDTTPRYDARLVAVKLAKLLGSKVLLASATPSVESFKKALDGVYSIHILKERARKGAKLPNIHIVDMRKEFVGGNRTVFSGKLYDFINDRLKKKEQVMLFLNRRGYANYAFCRSCGKVFKCPHCDVSLTVHNSWYHGNTGDNEKSALLSCHYCGYEAPLPRICPECGSKYVAPFGMGTQKLELYVKKMFPEARVIRMDADTTRKKGSFEKILSSFKDGKADVLIGTQMIVKGHDFEKVTLVGIVNADLSLYNQAYNACERTYELLTQASGRSGRAKKEGDVVIQSYVPDHYAISTAAREDYENFFKRELGYRKLLNYPPFTYMLFLRFSSPLEKSVIDAAKYAVFLVKESWRGEAEIIGPCNETIYKLQDRYRKILYIKHPSHDIILKIRDKIISAINSKFSGKNILVTGEMR